MGQDVFSLSAAQVTEALQHRDPLVFQQLYNACSEELYLLAYRWLKDNGLARDMVHNLFVHLWEKGTTLTITGHVRHYLFRAITNQCINELKRQQRQLGEELLQFERDPASLYESADYILLQKELLQHLRTLPPRCREIFILSRIHGLEPQEIAQKLGITLNTIYFQLSVALKTLRPLLLPKKKLE
ncbi:RNA polymerase sigma-70 factor, ECF subfamily [Chitinophaga costaii]|uniref:RNA polymerase sigma-70 factor, ECF subfamily n=1 Tax=Chitinophaga costaii TaxID=1335309 RepID=A0A1C4CW21_9BACT|nr:sigma-70 family RNA polymerase sigma factor [Chitinophaga costaii]PUZ26922.1 hypothetical protein DCM91_06685 [Chitinophaga costaii]SCC23238.1 RNA polymerase sigma-70 factor, ECF subfamily [Chitinophaga costaii]